MQRFVTTIQLFFVDLFGSILRFPIWWYSKGLVLTAAALKTSVTRYIHTIALLVWIKNLFVPMYGLRDWQGRLISFLVRLAQICGRALFLLVYVIGVLMLFLLYLALPIVVGFAVVYHASGLFV